MSTYWIPLGSDSLYYAGAWAAGTAYRGGEVVLYNGVYYLAAAASTGTTPPSVGTQVGTSLPASPVDGQEFVLVDSVTAPNYAWTFIYVAAITDANKWVFVGGSPASALVVAQETSTTNGSWINLGTVGPQFTLPRAGNYLVQISANGQKSAVEALSQIGVGVGDFTAGSELMTAIASSPVANAWGTMAANRVLSGLAAGASLRMKYYSGAAAGTTGWGSRSLLVTPVRVA